MRTRSPPGDHSLSLTVRGFLLSFIAASKSAEEPSSVRIHTRARANTAASNPRGQRTSKTWCLQSSSIEPYGAIDIKTEQCSLRARQQRCVRSHRRATAVPARAARNIFHSSLRGYMRSLKKKNGDRRTKARVSLPPPTHLRTLPPSSTTTPNAHSGMPAIPRRPQLVAQSA